VQDDGWVLADFEQVKVASKHKEITIKKRIGADYQKTSSNVGFLGDYVCACQP
jgi:hypothetical protein